jgi:hypothetical protein
VSEFASFERDVVRELVGSRLAERDAVLESAKLVSCEHTGVGYMLTVRHARLPQERIVCSEPLLVGKTGDYEFGFVVFIEKGELALECHSWGDEPLPNDLRSRDVRVRPVA